MVEAKFIHDQLERIEQLKAHPAMAEMKAVGITLVFDGVDTLDGEILYHLENAAGNETLIERGRSHFKNYTAPNGETNDTFAALAAQYLAHQKHYHPLGDISKVAIDVAKERQKEVAAHHKQLAKSFEIEGNLVTRKKPEASKR